jgi:hypothetical protein
MENGRRQLGAYIRALPSAKGPPLAVLRQYFPALGESDVTAEKWWTLSLARLSTLDRHMGMTLEQSDRLLTEALNITLPGKDGTVQTFSISDYAKFSRQPLRAEAIGRFNAAFTKFQTHAHPLLRPVADEYVAILELILRGKTRGLDKRIAAAEENRKNIISRAAGIADYLNWYEATQIQTRSGAFDDYLRMARAAASQPPQRHTDPVGRYLDSVEATMEGE